MVLAVAYTLVRIPTGDLAAQVFRTDLFDRAGFATWDNFWYGGHHVPGYSMLYPPLAALTSPRVVGSASLVIAALIFARLVRSRWEHIGLATAWFTVGMATNLLAGRLTFALGVAVGLGAVAAAAGRRPLLTVVLAGLTPLASPVAGAFLALGGAAVVGGAVPRPHVAALGPDPLRRAARGPGGRPGDVPRGRRRSRSPGGRTSDGLPRPSCAPG